MSEDYRDAVEVDFASADLETIVDKHFLSSSGKFLEFDLHEDVHLPHPRSECELNTILWADPLNFHLTSYVDVDEHPEERDSERFVEDGVASLRETRQVREAHKYDAKSFPGPVTAVDSGYVVGDSEEDGFYIEPDFDWLKLQSHNRRIPDFEEAVTDFGETLETFVNGAFRDYDFEETRTIRAYG